jgi:hypothetical protein
MTSLRKGIFVMVAILTFVFALSIGLSWYSFGYLDWSTVSTMGMMLMPVLAAATVIVLWTENPERPAAPREVSAQSTRARSQLQPSHSENAEELHVAGMKE